MPAKGQRMSPVDRLAEKFRKLPGVGKKSAYRMAFSVLDMSAEEAKDFAAAIVDAKENTTRCRCCMNISETELCHVCADSTRDHRLICVLEDPRDVASLDRIREYNGVYHVLHGAISPMLGIGPNDIRIKELLVRLQQEVDEVIIATNSSLEGEATAMYLSKLIKPTGIRVTRIASGVPVGGDLECIDEVTLLRALEGRTEL